MSINTFHMGYIDDLNGGQETSAVYKHNVQPNII